MNEDTLSIPINLKIVFMVLIVVPCATVFRFLNWQSLGRCTSILRNSMCGGDERSLLGIGLETSHN